LIYGLSSLICPPRAARRRSDSGEAEDRTARALGVDMGRLVEAVADTWGHTLSADALL
jgi:hypothetical protein